MISDYLQLDLVKELGLEVLPQAEREKVIADMESILVNRINAQIITRLDEPAQQELEKVIDSNGDVWGFYRSHITGFDLMLAEIVASFKEEMLGLRDTVSDVVNT